MDKEPLYNIDNFIGVFDNFYSDKVCDELINHYKLLKNNGYTHIRETEGVPKHIKDDTSTYNLLPQNMLDSNTPLDMSFETWHLPYTETTPIFWEKILPLYEKEYSVLLNTTKKYIQFVKIQETKPGQGYHIWHYENEDVKSSLRLLAFSLYLNDVEEGGETEFLYQKKRVKAKKNRLVLWPAYFTHPHRGNPPISNTKYMIAGQILMG